MTAYDEFKELRSVIDEKKEDLNKTLSKKFTEVLWSVFDDYPKLNCFSWVQFTPYFNDGDPCIFGVDFDSLALNSTETYDDGEDDAYDDDFYSNYFNVNTDPEAWDTLSEREHAWVTVQSILITAGEDVLKDVFGDHAKVTVKRDGTAEVEEYDHD